MKHHKLLGLLLAATISAGNMLHMSVSAAVTGDINGDGSADSTDLSLLQGYVLGNSELTQTQAKTADINGDGKTDIYDVVKLRKTILASDRSIKYTAVTDKITTGYTDAFKKLSVNDGGSAVTSTTELKTALSPYLSEALVNNYLTKYNDTFFSQSVLLVKPVFLTSSNYQKKKIYTTAECGCSSSYAGTYTTKNVTSYLNIRVEHSAASESIGRIPPNAIIPVSYGNGQWAHVTYDGISGYANMDYMQKISEPAPSYEFIPDLKVDSIKYSAGKLNITATEFKSTATDFAPAILIQTTISKKDYYANGTTWSVTITQPPELKYDYPLAKARLDAVGWDLQAAFKSAAATTYYGQKPDMPQTTDYSLEWYADYGFTNGKGNCYVMAAMFCEMGRLLGYDVHLISGKVPLKDGSMGAHSWTEVKIGDTTYVCDPDFAHETGNNGYMITYGQSGTWRYVKELVMD